MNKLENYILELLDYGYDVDELEECINKTDSSPSPPTNFVTNAIWIMIFISNDITHVQNVEKLEDNQHQEGFM